ncbi:SEFIR domain protein [Enhygromyxa salina]|uniref:SEFIR domain protein n=1 Tax=Enhygromyxa salina TaxID=215803 RepID=A0A2S9YM40_9BACT|nr:SEFIR domain protein [Enhygromyxa salina]
MFVSYSDDTPQHAERVLELAQWLRTHGIDAHIDQFEESPEEGWPRWIYTQIRESEYVLVVCTRGYLERCEGEVPRGRRANRAVKFESHLSLQEIHDAEGRNRKFIPLVFHDDDIGECVPLPLRSATHYRLPDQRDDLYRRLSDQPKIRPAPLGTLRTYDDDSRDALSVVNPILASESLEALIVTDKPAKRRKRAWSSGQIQRLLTVGAFGLAFLTTALFINSALTPDDGIDVDGTTCRIELTDPSGNAINSDYITLELPAGQEIAFNIENGNTLRFRCPTVAVQARVRVDTQAAETAVKSGTTEADNPAADAPAQRMLESTFTIQPELEMQTVRLGVPPTELAQPLPANEPTPDEPDDSNDSNDSDDSDDPGPGSLDSPVKDPVGPDRKQPTTKLGTKVELTLAPANPKLERVLKPKLERLTACVSTPPSPAVKVSCGLQQDTDGAIVNVRIDDAQLRAQDVDAADCAQRELRSWAEAGSKYDRTGSSTELTLKFSAR